MRDKSSVKEYIWNCLVVLYKSYSHDIYLDIPGLQPQIRKLWWV